MAYTYTPKVGDVVRFPNGIEVNYSEAHQALVVLHGKGLPLTLKDQPAEGIIVIGVSQ